MEALSCDNPTDDHRRDDGERLPLGQFAREEDSATLDTEANAAPSPLAWLDTPRLAQVADQLVIAMPGERDRCYVFRRDGAIVSEEKFVRDLQNETPTGGDRFNARPEVLDAGFRCLAWITERLQLARDRIDEKATRKRVRTRTRPPADATETQPEPPAALVVNDGPTVEQMGSNEAQPNDTEGIDEMKTGYVRVYEEGDAVVVEVKQANGLRVQYAIDPTGDVCKLAKNGEKCGTKRHFATGLVEAAKRSVERIAERLTLAETVVGKPKPTAKPIDSEPHHEAERIAEPVVGREFVEVVPCDDAATFRIEPLPPSRNLLALALASSGNDSPIGDTATITTEPQAAITEPPSDQQPVDDVTQAITDPTDADAYEIGCDPHEATEATTNADACNHACDRDACGRLAKLAYKLVEVIDAEATVINESVEPAAAPSHDAATLAEITTEPEPATITEPITQTLAAPLADPTVTLQPAGPLDLSAMFRADFVGSF